MNKIYQFFNLLVVINTSRKPINAVKSGHNSNKIQWIVKETEFDIHFNILYLHIGKTYLSNSEVNDCPFTMFRVDEAYYK